MRCFAAALFSGLFLSQASNAQALFPDEAETVADNFRQAVATNALDVKDLAPGFVAHLDGGKSETGQQLKRKPSKNGEFQPATEPFVKFSNGTYVTYLSKMPTVTGSLLEIVKITDGSKTDGSKIAEYWRFVTAAKDTEPSANGMDPPKR